MIVAAPAAAPFRHRSHDDAPPPDFISRVPPALHSPSRPLPRTPPKPKPASSPQQVRTRTCVQSGAAAHVLQDGGRPSALN